MKIFSGIKFQSTLKMPSAPKTPSTIKMPVRRFTTPPKFTELDFKKTIEKEKVVIEDLKNVKMAVEQLTKYQKSLEDKLDKILDEKKALMMALDYRSGSNGSYYK